MEPLKGFLVDRSIKAPDGFDCLICLQRLRTIVHCSTVIILKCALYGVKTRIDNSSNNCLDLRIKNQILGQKIFDFLLLVKS